MIRKTSEAEIERKRDIGQPTNSGLIEQQLLRLPKKHLRDDFIKHNSVAPYISHGRVKPAGDGLGGHPADRQHSLQNRVTLSGQP